MDPTVIIPKIPEIISKLYYGITPIFLHDRPEIILFGSYARRDAEYGSDLDIMILVDTPRSAISELSKQVDDVSSDLSLDYDIVISPIVENRDFFNNYLPVLPFFQNVRREGVKISA